MFTTNNTSLKRNSSYQTPSSLDSQPSKTAKTEEVVFGGRCYTHNKTNCPPCFPKQLDEYSSVAGILFSGRNITPITGLEDVGNSDCNISNIKDIINTQIQATEVKENEVLSLQNMIQSIDPANPLQLAELKDRALLPKYKFTIDNATYYCSQRFNLYTSHQAVLVIVQIEDDRAYPLILYFSNSQAVWRVVPAYYAEYTPDGDVRKRHFGKGRGEIDVQVPTALSLALCRLPSASVQAGDELLKKVVEMVPFGDYPPDWKETVKIFPLMPIKALEQDESERAKFVRMYRHRPFIPDPEKLPMPQNPLDYPDFSNGLEETPISCTLYEAFQIGPLTPCLYLSKNKELLYLFYKAKGKDMIFLASVEKVHNNPITKYGVRSSVPDTGKSCTPLIEYERQMQDECTPKNEWYQIMPEKEIDEWHKKGWSSFFAYGIYWNYLRRMKLIETFFKEQGREMHGAI